MKGVFKLFLTLVILSGCSSNEPILDGSDIKMLSYTYSENSYNQYIYLLSIKDYLANNNVNIDSLKMYAEGFSTGTKRRNIYTNVEKIIFDYLSSYYNEQIITSIFEANAKLSQLSNGVSNYLTHKPKMSANEIFEIRERIDDLQTFIYPEEDETEINLYNLTAKPEDIIKKYSSKEIEIFFEKFITALNQLNHTLEQKR